MSVQYRHTFTEPYCKTAHAAAHNGEGNGTILYISTSACIARVIASSQTYRAAEMPKTIGFSERGVAFNIHSEHQKQRFRQHSSDGRVLVEGPFVLIFPLFCSRIFFLYFQKTILTLKNAKRFRYFPLLSNFQSLEIFPVFVGKTNSKIWGKKLFPYERP